MSMIQSDLLLGQEGGAGYTISRSLRFNSGDSAYLSRTPASAGNRKTWTLSFWKKFSKFSGTSDKSFAAFDGTNIHYLEFPSNNLEFATYNGSHVFRLTTSQVFRDPSAWYHILIAFDTTQATASNRVRIYVNRNEVTAFSTAAYPSLNYDGVINSNQIHTLGAAPPGTYVGYMDGYLAEVFFIEGQQLTPSSFTEVSATTGQLIPKAYTGTFTGNSFWLKFADNSAATATTLGKDSSGLGNNWTPNNLTATELYGRLYRQATGTATSAFSSANLVGNFPASASGNYIYDVELNTSITTATFGYLHAFGGVEVLVSNDGTNWTSKGVQTNAYTTVTNSTPFKYVRWFIAQSWMHGITNNPANIDSTVDTPTSSGTDTGLGGQVTGNYCTWNPLFKSPSNGTGTLSNGNLTLSQSSAAYIRNNATIGMSSGKWYSEITVTSGGGIIGVGIATGSVDGGPGASNSYTYHYDGSKYTPSNSSYGASYTTGDVIGLAFDADAGSLVCYKNGSSQGTLVSGLAAGTYFFTAYLYAYDGPATKTLDLNAGQRPFAYTAPSGFKALCDTNLPAPVVAKPSDYFQTVLYTGNGSTQTISGLGFSPDLVWIKSRNNSGWWNLLFDQVRGAGKWLSSNVTDAEAGNGSQLLSAFTSNGFTLNVDPNGTVNANNDTYVAWAWDAGANTVSNTAGSITSQVRANASAGFSIVTYTGTGANASVGHGCGTAPSLIIIKARTQAVARSWTVYHKSIGNTKFLQLNATTGEQTYSAVWNNTSPTSSVFTVGTEGDVNANGYNYVAYAFSPVAGYSAALSWTGNGSSDGPLLYCGFAPKFFIVKCASGITDWWMLDVARSNTGNPVDEWLSPNRSDSEYGNNEDFDFVSNGIKIRTSTGSVNGSGATYIGFAWAENPFQYARAR